MYNAANVALACVSDVPKYTREGRIEIMKVDKSVLDDIQVFKACKTLRCLSGLVSGLLR